MGRPIEKFIDEFDPVPLAAASIAQVHKAKLKNGREVIIKIQRPEITKFIHLDLEILRFGASRYMEIYGDKSAVDLLEVVNNFEPGFLRELSFLNEAANQNRFAITLKDDPAIYVPEVHRQLCTETVLVMDFVKGIKVTDLDKYESINSQPKSDWLRCSGRFLSSVFFMATHIPGIFLY